MSSVCAVAMGYDDWAATGRRAEIGPGVPMRLSQARNDASKLLAGMMSDVVLLPLRGHAPKGSDIAADGS